MDDGTPPTERVAIERVCGGVARKEGYTDSRGYFGFQLGWNLGVVQDASVGSTFDPFGRDQSSLTPGLEANTGVSQSELMNCDLRASLPGFRSNSLSLANRRPLEHNDVGMLVLYRMGAVQGTTISAASMQAPKDAKKAYKKGHELLGKNKPEEAQEHLERAVELYPKYADAWFDLGLTHEAQRQPDEAKKCYHEALAADSRYINPYWQLTLFSVRENNWKQVLELTDKALALNPLDYPLGHFYNAVANLYLQRLDAAEHSARKAQMLDGSNRIPKVHLLLGQILSQKGDYSAAAEQIRGYLKAEPKAQDAEKLKAEITRLEGLTNGAAKAKN
jgi:tetratricopeptide (TPR) repeat protein